MGRAAEPITRSAAMYFTYIVAIMNGVLPPTAAVLREAEEALAVAEQSGENVELGQGRQYLGIILVHMGGSSRARGFQLLDQVRAMAVEKRYNDSRPTHRRPCRTGEDQDRRFRRRDLAWHAAVNEFFRPVTGCGQAMPPMSWWMR